MNKGRIIIFSVGGIVVLLGLIGIVALFSGNSEKEKESDTPILSSKDNFTYMDMVEINGTNTNEYTQNSKIDSNIIKDQISSIYGIEQVKSEKPGKKEKTVTSYNPYGNRSMYVVPENKPKPQTIYYGPQATGEPTSQVVPKTEVITVKNNSIEADLERKKRLFEGRSAPSSTAGIKAVIRGTQNRKNGQTLRFALSEDLYLGSILIPRGTNFYGVIRFSNYRVNVNITSININSEIVPCDFTVYSTDGLQGIPVWSDQVLNKAKDETGDEIAKEVESSLGTPGKILGGILKGKNKEIAIKFIDNQQIFLVQNSN